MTTLAEKIAVMQAALAGKAIQNKLKNVSNILTWGTTVCPSWNWEKYDYRVRPEKKLVRIASLRPLGLLVATEERDMKQLENASYFDKWVTDWIEVDE